MHFHGEGGGEQNQAKQESLRFSSLTFADETSSSEMSTMEETKTTMNKRGRKSKERERMIESENE